MKKLGFGKILLIIAIITVMVFVAACSKSTKTNTTSTTASTTTTTTTSQTIQYTINSTSKTGIGAYLIDGKGMTLYWTSRDSVGQSNITGTTLANWPVFYVSNMLVPSSLNAADFGSITRADGSKQSTFKGWPLYYYIKDQAAGDTLGQGLAGVWFAVVPTASAPPPPPTTTNSTTSTSSTTTTSTSSTTTKTTTTSSSTTASTTTTPTSTTTTPYSY